MNLTENIMKDKTRRSFSKVDTFWKKKRFRKSFGVFSFDFFKLKILRQTEIRDCEV